mmetsp:Transcript_13601/g.15778  ORF Transcript_13601/g.15778 Transcript_13601/m.15778 type:complete len:110 (+) Transcript_13601:31-360(+)
MKPIGKAKPASKAPAKAPAKTAVKAPAKAPAKAATKAPVKKSPAKPAGMGMPFGGAFGGLAGPKKSGKPTTFGSAMETMNNLLTDLELVDTQKPEDILNSKDRKETLLN